MRPRGREGDATINPSYCIRNTGNSQKLFCATPIPFGATHVEFRTSQSEVRKKCVMSYLILRKNSVDYLDGVQFLKLCKKRFVLDLCCVKMYKKFSYYIF